MNKDSRGKGTSNNDNNNTVRVERVSTEEERIRNSGCRCSGSSSEELLISTMPTHCCGDGGGGRGEGSWRFCLGTSARRSLSQREGGATLLVGHLSLIFSAPVHAKFSLADAWIVFYGDSRSNRGSYYSALSYCSIAITVS